MLQVQLHISHMSSQFTEKTKKLQLVPPITSSSYKEHLFHPVVSNCLARLLIVSDISILGALLDRDPL